jgi:pimeloyl-ACP methyl ester carboxylesterase
MPKCKVGNEGGAPVAVHYEDHGQGKPVVLIHGWPLSSRTWEPQELTLTEAGYRVIKYDRRGFGDSSRPWSGYDYDTMASDLNALMNHLDLQDATIVGFSMGGGEVARYISNHGTSRLAGAVLAAAVTPYLYKSDDNPGGGVDDETIATFEEAVRGDRAAFLEDFTKNFFTPQGGDESLVSGPLRHFARWQGSIASAKGTLDCIAAWSRTDFRDDLAKIDVPTLVIHGDADAIVPFEVSGKRSHEAIADSTLTVIEGGPHGINATHPDEFNTALLGFLGR